MKGHDLGSFRCRGLGFEAVSFGLIFDNNENSFASVEHKARNPISWLIHVNDTIWVLGSWLEKQVFSKLDEAAGYRGHRSLQPVCQGLPSGRNSVAYMNLGVVLELVRDIGGEA
jgi:hypothetical protein